MSFTLATSTQQSFLQLKLTTINRLGANAQSQSSNIKRVLNGKIGVSSKVVRSTALIHDENSLVCSTTVYEQEQVQPATHYCLLLRSLLYTLHWFQLLLSLKFIPCSVFNLLWARTHSQWLPTNRAWHVVVESVRNDSIFCRRRVEDVVVRD